MCSKPKSCSHLSLGHMYKSLKYCYVYISHWDLLNLFPSERLVIFLDLCFRWVIHRFTITGKQKLSLSLSHIPLTHTLILHTIYTFPSLSLSSFILGFPTDSTSGFFLYITEFALTPTHM